MKFDNEGTTIKIHVLKTIMAIISGVLIALMVFIPGFYNFLIDNTGIPKYLFIILFSLVFIIFYLYHLVSASAFLSFDDEEDKIVIRFYRFDIFNPSKVAYEISFADFVGYKVEQRYLKLCEDLILFRMYQGDIVKYPPIPISALTRSERKKMLTALDSHIPKLQ